MLIAKGRARGERGVHIVATHLYAAMPDNTALVATMGDTQKIAQMTACPPALSDGGESQKGNGQEM